MITVQWVNELAEAAQCRQRAAHRPGTNAGRASAVRPFLQFCRAIKVSYRKISYCHVCWYIELLANKGLGPGSITNTISHLRTYYKMMALSDAALYHYRVSLALRAISISIRRESRAKLDAPPDLFKRAIQANKGRAEEEATTLAFIIMYTLVF